MIQYQILWTNIIRIVWQIVRRITNQILGVKELIIWFSYIHSHWIPVQYKKTSDENKQIFELGDCLLIQHQILETNIIRIV